MALAKTLLLRRLIFFWAACRLTVMAAASRAAILPCCSALALARWAAATAATIWSTRSLFCVCSCCMIAARLIMFCALLVVSSDSVVSSPLFM